MIVQVGRQQDIRRVERRAIAHPLRYAGNSRQDRAGSVLRSLVFCRRVEADTCWLGLQLSDGCVELLREDTAQQKVVVPHGSITTSVEGRACDALDDRERHERRYRKECTRRR